MYTNIYTDLNQHRQRKHILWPKYGLFVLQPYIGWMEACFDRGVDSVNETKKKKRRLLKTDWKRVCIKLRKGQVTARAGTRPRAAFTRSPQPAWARTFAAPRASWIIACLSKLILGLLCAEGSFIYVCIYLFMLNLMGVCT